MSDPMGEILEAGVGEDPRVERLLRVNAELAAEIRGLQEGRIERPRTSVAPSARRLARLISNRDWLVEEVDQLRADLEEQEEKLRAETQRTASLEKERQRLVEQIHEYGAVTDSLQAEVERLRGGFLGFLRRTAARGGAPFGKS